MLVERGVRVMNMGVVGDAYAIAANYLRRTGAIPDDFTTNDGCSRSSCRCFTAAKSTSSGSPTHRRSTEILKSRTFAKTLSA